jgi:hypothetical protein
MTAHQTILETHAVSRLKKKKTDKTLRKATAGADPGKAI